MKPKLLLAELNVWRLSNEACSRIYVDYMGPLQNKYFLVVADVYFKWFEASPTTSITTNTNEYIGLVLSIIIYLTLAATERVKDS